MNAVPLHRANSFLLFSILICVVLYYGREVLVVLAYSILFAMLMTPVANFLEHKGMHRILSTIVSLIIVITVLSGVITLVAIQIMNLTEELSIIQDKVDDQLHNLQSFIHEKFQVSPERQIQIVKQHLKGLTQSTGAFLKSIIMGFTGTLASLAVVLLFMFLLLLEREKYKRFLLRLYDGSNPEEAKRVINDASKIAQRYLWGRFISIVILTAAYTVGLLIIGIENAFLLSAIAALLTIIPYIGPFIGGLFPFSMTLVTEDSFGTALWVAAVLLFIQMIDNYFVEPYVVGGAVNLNMLFTILTLIVGGYIWGISGVILFLPLVGIVKVVMDNVPSLEHYGYLLGSQKEEKENIPSKIIDQINK